MTLKAYKTSNAQRALRATLVSDYLDSTTLERYRISLDCSSISNDIYISRYPYSLATLVLI